MLQRAAAADTAAGRQPDRAGPVACEDDDTIGPFGGAAANSKPLPASPAARAPAAAAAAQQRRRRWALCGCGLARVDRPAHASSSSGGGGGSSGTAEMATQTSRGLSRKLSAWGSGRRSVKRLGSLAYSDAEWYDAGSKFAAGSADHAAMLAEVDSMVRHLDSRGPWVPDPPLAFGDPGMQFVPLPEATGFAGYWERDNERTTPPPQPIDVMLRASFVTRKSHDSVPGVWFQESPSQLTMTVKPRFVPPGFPRYIETYDKSNAGESSWGLRRDLKTGRSYGKIYLTADGTLIFRVWTKPLFGGDVDVVMEEYMRLEEGGQVLVARECALHVASGARAVQYLVGRRHEVPPKGHV